MKWILPALLVFNLVLIPTSKQEPYPFKNETKTDCKSSRGRAVLTLNRTTLRRGEHSAARFSFHSAASQRVYNPSFKGLILFPGQLAIYNAQKKYLGAMEFETLSRRTPEKDDWVFLPRSFRMETNIEFLSGYLPLNVNPNFPNLLPAGKYYVQLILYKAFLTASPDLMNDREGKFYKTIDRSELCRSNRVGIELID